MEGNEKSAEIVILDSDELKEKVDAIVNGTTDVVPAPKKKQRDHAHEYQLKKKRMKKKRSRVSSSKPKNTVSSEVKNDIPSNDSTGSGAKKSYQEYLDEYEKSLDGDATTDQGPSSVVPSGGDEVSTISEGDPAPKPRKYASSLVVLTNFILPAFCTITVRLIGKGKKRPSSKDFMLTEADRAMLREIADDGAGEEILSQINPALTYLLVMAAIGFNKVTDYWDSDSYEKVSGKLIELDQKLTDITEKYNKLLAQVKPDEVTV